MQLFKVTVAESHTLSEVYVVAEDWASAVQAVQAKLNEWAWDTTRISDVSLKGEQVDYGFDTGTANVLALLMPVQPYAAISERLKAEISAHGIGELDVGLRHALEVIAQLEVEENER